MAEVGWSPAIIPSPSNGLSGLGASTVFVYGSLKRGQPNYHWLTGAPWLGEASLDGVQLFDLGPFPMAVKEALSPRGGHPLRGEHYQVDQPILERLDRLEGAPRLFQRHWCTLRDGQGAWVYLGRPSQVRHAPLIAHCRWMGPREARWWRPESLG